jgi:hypothetical protein
MWLDESHVRRLCVVTHMSEKSCMTSQERLTLCRQPFSLQVSLKFVFDLNDQVTYIPFAGRLIGFHTS